MAENALNDRQGELGQAFVAAWERSGHVPFDLRSDQPFSHPAWPADVSRPDRGEVRSLCSLGMLEVDDSVAPTWRVHPSPAARLRFGADGEEQAAAALSDPDRRLGTILEATVQAFEADPAEPLRLWPMGGGDLLRHSSWRLQPDVVRTHDLQQLQQLGLVSLSPQDRGHDFWPTADGRAAVHNAAGLLERRSQTSSSEQEATRLRQWAQRLRTGDFAVGVAAGTASAAVRALIGL